MRTVAELMTIEGRRVLVTGATGHLGLAIGTAIAEMGARVAVLDREPNACREQAECLSHGDPERALAVPCDLMDEQATRGAVRSVVETWGGLDGLVHCAAFVGTTAYPGWAVPFEQQTVEAWDAALRVNLTAAFVLAQAGQAALAGSGCGAICFIGSIYGVVGPDMRLYEDTAMGNPAGYGATKGGLLQLTRYLATVLAPDIRVNCISPGGIFRHQPAVFVERYTARTPLRRMATEEDLTCAVAYLLSDASSYVTGHNLVVDGGWTAV